MSWDNEERCPTLKREGVHLNQSAYSPRGNGGCASMVERNKIKELCRKCKRKRCVY